MRQPVALHYASRLINHGPIVLVTTEHGGAWLELRRIAEPHTEQAYDRGAGAVAGTAATEPSLPRCGQKRIDADSRKEA